MGERVSSGMMEHIAPTRTQAHARSRAHSSLAPDARVVWLVVVLSLLYFSFLIILIYSYIVAKNLAKNLAKKFAVFVLTYSESASNYWGFERIRGLLKSSLKSSLKTLRYTKRLSV